VVFYLEGMLMRQRIGLFHDSTRYGEVELETVFVMEPADYTCEPTGVISYEEVRQIATVLRRTPHIESGVVGYFSWCKEYPPQSFRSSTENSTV
jgi:hypothetical protein